MQRAVTAPAPASEAVREGSLAEPCRLPARVSLEADEARRLPPGTAEIGRAHVVVRREGTEPAVPTAVAPVSAYRGVAVRVVGPDASGEPVFRVSLHHGDPALCVPLASGSCLETIAEVWRAWARLFGLPMLAIDEAGNVHGALHQIGAFFAAPPAARRRGSGLVGRRSRAARRRAVPAARETVVIRDAREIIART